jgi:hypothetical protein
MTPEQYVAKLYGDFHFFLDELWRDRRLDEVAPLGTLEHDIAEYAAHGPQRRIILAFRGVGKTHLITAGLTLWRAFRDPHRQFLHNSKSSDAAKKTVKLIRSWLRDVPFLRHLQPSEYGRDTDQFLDFGPVHDKRQPSLISLGVGGQLENNRAHTIIGDDLETKTNSKTPESRAELARILPEYTAILYPDRPVEAGGSIDPTEVVLVGTPKHDDTVYLRLAKHHGYDLRSWPIVYPKTGYKVHNLAPRLKAELDSGQAKPNDPTCPHRFNRLEIAKREAEGWTEFAREYLLIADPQDDQLYPIKLSDLIVLAFDRRAPIDVTWGERDHAGSTRTDPFPCLGLGDDCLRRPASMAQEWAPFLRTIMWIDPAGAGTDEAAACPLSTLHGLFYVHPILGLPDGRRREDMEAMILHARTHNAREIYIESNADTFGLYTETFASLLPKFTLKPGEHPDHPEGWSASLVRDHKLTHSVGRKEQRIIDALATLTRSHRLIVHPDALRPDPAQPDHLNLQHQLARITRFPGCLKDDGKIDALAGAILVLRHSASTQTDKSVQRFRDSQAWKDYQDLLREAKPHLRPLQPRRDGSRSGGTRRWGW